MNNKTYKIINKNFFGTTQDFAELKDSIWGGYSFLGLSVRLENIKDWLQRGIIKQYKKD